MAASRPSFWQAATWPNSSADVLDCFSGDETLVAPAIFDDDVALGAYLGDIAAECGVAIGLAAQLE